MAKNNTLDWVKALAPLATTLIPMMARGGGQSGMSGLPPEFSQLLQQQIQQNAQQQPLRNAANSMAFSMLPNWAREGQSAQSSTVPMAQNAPGGFQVPGGGTGSGQALGMAASLGSKFVPGMSAIPMAGPIIAGISLLAPHIRNWAGNQTNRGRQEFASQMTGIENRDDAMGQFWTWLQQRVKPETYQQLYHTATQVIGRNDQAANSRWMSDVMAAVNAGR
jgi:hypothetical protein